MGGGNIKRYLLLLTDVYITVTIILSVLAYAHIPVFSKNVTIQNAVTIKDSQASYAVYGNLKEEGQVDYIRFYAKKGDPVYIELAVPMLKDEENFMPSFALIGKGMPESNNVMPFTVPDDCGFAIFNSGKKYGTYFEPYTQTIYIVRQEIRMKSPSTGEFYIAAYSPQGKEGKYLIAIGEKDKFNFMDVLIFPYLWLKVKYWFNPARAISIVIVLALVITGIIYYIRKKKRGE